MVEIANMAATFKVTITATTGTAPTATAVYSAGASTKTKVDGKFVLLDNAQAALTWITTPANPVICPATVPIPALLIANTTVDGKPPLGLGDITQPIAWSTVIPGTPPVPNSGTFTVEIDDAGQTDVTAI
jgi:hypothetical protein